MSIFWLWLLMTERTKDSLYGVAGESVEYAAFGVGLAEQQGDRRGAESFRIAERAGRDGGGERLVLEKFRHEETECRQVIPYLEMLFLD